MKRTILVFMMVFMILFSGCSGREAEELFKTAKFEELQNNHEHARELYQEIIRKYPNSEYAKEAKARLSALQKGKSGNVP